MHQCSLSIFVCISHPFSSIHPIRVARGYEKAAEIATEVLKSIGDVVSPFNNTEH